MVKTAVNVWLRRGGKTLWQRFLAQSTEWKLHWLLRLGVGMEFVGHGACGLHTKAGWLPYFGVFAIPEAMAWKIMPWVGAMDVALGLSALLAPRRAVLLYMGVWGAFTALLRPAAGEGWFEAIERAYNYGVPFAFLLLHGWATGRRDWFAVLRTVPALTPERERALRWLLRAVVGLMLIGHGGFGPFLAKKNLLGFYDAVGLDHLGLPLETIRAGIGFLEIGLGVTVFLVRSPRFFASVCLWKITTESLFLVASAPLACWEIIERGGSYVAPLAVLCLLLHERRRTATD